MLSNENPKYPPKRDQYEPVRKIEHTTIQNKRPDHQLTDAAGRPRHL